MSSKNTVFNAVSNDENNCFVNSEDTTLEPSDKTPTPKMKNSSNASRKRKLSQPKDKPFQCPSCPKCFSREGYLKMHSVSHESDESKSLLCSECGRAFSLLGHLTLHMRSHTRGTTTAPKPKRRRVEKTEPKVEEFVMIKSANDESLIYEEHQHRQDVSNDSVYLSPYNSSSMWDDTTSNLSVATSSSGFSVENEWSHCYDFCELHPETASSVDCEIFKITSDGYEKDFTTVVLGFKSF